MSILPKLGRRALTSITATAIIAGGVVAPQALADDVKNADLYWGFSGSSHSATPNTPKPKESSGNAKIEPLDQTHIYKETFSSGKLPTIQNPDSKVIAFNSGSGKNDKNNEDISLQWKGSVTLSIGYGDTLKIEDPKLELKDKNSGTFKASIGENKDVTLFSVEKYDVTDSTIVVTPKSSNCNQKPWNSWSEELVKLVGYTKSVYFEGYDCQQDTLARQPLPLTVVLNAEKPAEQANPASNKDNTSGEHSDQEHSVISDQEQLDSPEAAAGDTTFSKAKEFLGTKIGRILTIGLSVLGGLGALWTLWTKFSHLFIR
ncbi:hypothetical protein [Corynebacterium rouxii]|uniref:hypothetical protein n=1 Tax=Corynebacterium rouxii TaxID=2719119 RepID=UPI00313CDEAC